MKLVITLTDPKIVENVSQKSSEVMNKQAEEPKGGRRKGCDLPDADRVIVINCFVQYGSKAPS